MAYSQSTYMKKNKKEKTNSNPTIPTNKTNLILTFLRSQILLFKLSHLTRDSTQATLSLHFLPKKRKKKKGSPFLSLEKE